VTDFKAGDRVKVTMTRSFEGDVIARIASPSGLAVRDPGDDVHWLTDSPDYHGSIYTFELIAPAEPPMGSVLVSSGLRTWERGVRGWYAPGVEARHSWEEVSTYGPFTVLREGWGE
jgi:hypothetical protein